MNKVAADAPTGANGPLRSESGPSRKEFVEFVRGFAEQCRQRPEEWENRDLPSFLEAMAAWVDDMDGYYRNRGEAVPEQPTWKMLVQILQAARVYE